jgi:hypothetical protein
MKRNTETDAPHTLRGDALKPSARAAALAGFIYRNTHENYVLNPGPVIRARGTFASISDEAWLFHTSFAVTPNGNLKKNTSCHVHDTEIPERAAALDKWNSERLALSQS